MARATNSLPAPEGPVIEGGELAHAGIEGAAVAPHIVGENGLPDGSAKAGGGHGAADDVLKDPLEGALDLPEAGEGVARVVSGGEADALDLEQAAPVLEEVAIEPPAGARLALGERGFEEFRVIALVEQQQGGVLIEGEVGFGGAGVFGQTGPQPLQRLRHPLRDAPGVGARPVFAAPAPYRLAFHELGPQNGALQLHTFGEKGITVS